MGDDICEKVKNRHLSPTMIEKAMKNMSKLDFYTDWMHFNSPGTDSQVLSLNRGGNPITVSISESHNKDLEIRGSQDNVHAFIREMTAEVASLAIKELCHCLTEDMEEDWENQLRDDLLSLMNKYFH